MHLFVGAEIICACASLPKDWPKNLFIQEGVFDFVIVCFNYVCFNYIFTMYWLCGTQIILNEKCATNKMHYYYYLGINLSEGLAQAVWLPTQDHSL